MYHKITATHKFTTKFCLHWILQFMYSTLLCINAITITWISDNNKARGPEITIPVVFPPRLVIEIHGYGSMVHEIVRVRAGASFLQNPAINLRAGIIEVGQKGCLIWWRLCHTPSFLSISHDQIRSWWERQEHKEKEKGHIRHGYKYYCLNYCYWLLLWLLEHNDAERERDAKA